MSESNGDFPTGAIHKLEFLAGKDGIFYRLLTHFTGGNIKIKVAFFSSKYCFGGGITPLHCVAENHPRGQKTINFMFQPHTL